MKNSLARYWHKLWYGLVLVSICTFLGFGLSKTPYIGTFGTLVLALIAGIIVGNVIRKDGELDERYKAGIKFSSKTLLELGVVLLGMRLNFLLIAELGITFLLANILVIFVGIVVLELVGQKFGLSPSLRRSIGVGTSICGSSAIAAAVPILKPTDEETGVAITVVNLVGTVGVFLYITMTQFFTPSDVLFGALAGTTLQSVGQVIAAGYSFSNESGDIALVVKLMRVALLVPVLVILSLATRKSTGETTGKRPPLLPWFLIGFLLVGLFNTLVPLPELVKTVLNQLSLIFTALAMAAIGLGVNLSIFGKLGSRSIYASFASFIAMIVFVLPYTSFLHNPVQAQTSVVQNTTQDSVSRPLENQIQSQAQSQAQNQTQLLTSGFSLPKATNRTNQTMFFETEANTSSTQQTFNSATPNNVNNIPLANRNQLGNRVAVRNLGSRNPNTTNQQLQNRSSIIGLSNLVNFENDDVDIALPRFDTQVIYRSRGLPAGLELNPDLGIISGRISPSSIGDYLVSIQVSDGMNTIQEQFMWRIAN